MSSLGRLTLDLVADPTQLNSDLDAVKAHAQAIARDIEQQLRNAFRGAVPATPPTIPAPVVQPVRTDPWKFLKDSLKNLKRDLQVTFNNIRTFNFSALARQFKDTLKNLPSIATSAIKLTGNVLKTASTEIGKSIASNISKGVSGGIKGIQSSLGAVGFGAFASAGAAAFNTVTGVISGAINKVKEFSGGLFDTLREVQKFDARLKTFVTDADKRAELNKRLNEFAKTTPFELKTVRESAIRNLSTMTDPSELNLDKYMADLKALGDVAAGSQQNVGELATKFAKARSEGRATNVDLQEWAGRGIPIYQELGKIIGGTTEEIRAMAKGGKINFEELSAAIRSMTQEGGVFFKAMENQSTTLEGKMSNISDTFYQFKELLSKAFEPLANLGVNVFGEMVSGLSDSKNLMDDIKKETQKLADYFKENPEIAKALNKSLQDIVKGAMKGLVDGVKTFVEFFKDNPQIIKKTADAIGTVSRIFSQVVGFAVEIASTLANSVLTALNKNNSVTESFFNLLDSVKNLWEQNKEVIEKVAESVGSALGTALNVVLELVTGIFDFFGKYPEVLGVILKAVELVAKVIETIFAVCGEILKFIGNIIVKIGEWAVSTKPVQDFFNFVGSIFDKVMTGMDGIIAKTGQWFNSLKPVQDALGAIGNLINSNASTGIGDSIAGSMQGALNGGGSGKGGAPLLGQGYDALNQLGGELAQNKYFDPSTDEGRGRLAIALGIGGSESFEKGTSRRAFYTQRGGTGNNMQGFGQFNRAYHANKIDTPDKYKTFIGKILAGEERLPNSQQGIGDYGAKVVEAVKTGRIKNGADLIRWMQQSKLGGSNWQGVDDGWKRNPGLADQLVAYIRGDGQTQSAPSFPERSGGSSAYGGSEGSVVQNQGLTVLGSSGEGRITDYAQLKTHHHNSRGGGRGREGNRQYQASSTNRGALEEVRTSGVAGGVHIKKDFVLADKNGNQNVPSPSPASGIVQDIYPGVGGVVIGDGKGRRLATSLHLKNIRVKRGDRVSYGQILGTQSYIGSKAVHSHIEMPEGAYRKFIKDLQSGRFGSAPQQENAASSAPTGFDESNVGMPQNSKTSGASGSSGGSSSSPTAAPNNSGGVSQATKQALLTSRRKEQESTYKEISDEIEFSQRNQRVEQKQKREQEDSERKRKNEEAKAQLKLKAAQAESPEAKKILERQVARFDVDTKYDEELQKLQRQREDLVLAQSNKLKAMQEAEKRKNEFIATKKAAGESYTEADLEKFKVRPDEGASMDFSKAIKDLDKMIASQKTLKDLELQTLGLEESADDKRERRAKQRERDIEQLKRQNSLEVDSLKKLASSVTDEDLKKQFEDQIAQKELQLNAKIELMPIDDQLEDLGQALSEVLAAGVSKDSPEAKEIQAQIDELKKQKEDIARKSGLDLTLLENERKQAETERNREKTAETRELEHKNAITEIDKKISAARSDSEKATLEFEKERLELLKEQTDEQQPLLDKLADLQKDKTTLLGAGVKEDSAEMKLLEDSIKNVNTQLSLLKEQGSTAMDTLAKESAKAIAEAKKSDEARLAEKQSLLSGSDVKVARLDQMQSRNADPYKISALEKEIALSEEALRYRQEMAEIEEKIASFRGTNAELSAAEENQLRNNAAAIHEINVEKVHENVRTLGKDLSDIGKGAVKDFFGQLVSGSMDFNSIMQSIISQIGNLAVELIQSELFGEGGLFGKKSKKDDNSDGGLLGDLVGGSKDSGSGLLGGIGTTGSSPMQPAFVSVVGGSGSLGGGIDSLFGNNAGDGQGQGFLDSVFGGGKLSFNKSNPLPIDMVSADKNAFSGLGDIFSGIFGGGAGGGGGLGGILSGVLGGGASATGGGGGIFGSILGILPSIFGFADGGKVEGLGIDKLPKGNNPIAKALKAERMISGRKPVLAVLHEGELVLNREQQERLGIYDVPKFDSGGMVGGAAISKSNKNEINLNFNTSGEDKSDIDINSLRAVINAEIVRQQGSGGSLGSGSYARRGR